MPSIARCLAALAAITLFAAPATAAHAAPLLQRALVNNETITKDTATGKTAPAAKGGGEVAMEECVVANEGSN